MKLKTGPMLKIDRALLTTGRLLKVVSIIAGVASAFYMLGIAGHADYCIEANILDTWAPSDYIIRSIICIVTMFISLQISKFSARIEEYYHG